MRLLKDLNPSRIALIKPSALGDIVHSLPVLTALRHRFPAAQITWVVNKSYASLIEGHPHLDSLLVFDRGAGKKSLFQALDSLGNFYQKLRKHRFDLVIDLQGLFRTGLMCLASGAKRRVGLSTAREGAILAYTDRIAIPKAKSIHAIDRYWEVARSLGATQKPLQFHLPVSMAAQQWASKHLEHLPRPWIMVGPGSRWLTKRWPPRHFAQLAQRSRQQFGGSIILVGGPDEVDLSREVQERLQGNATDLTGQTTLPQLAAILLQADLMLSNDTGPLHLAVALGRPVVAPYTCTKVALTGPYHSTGGAVETSVWCRGSYLKRCDRMECMDELVPDRLWPLVHEVLQTWVHHPDRKIA